MSIRRASMQAIIVMIGIMVMPVGHPVGHASSQAGTSEHNTTPVIYTTFYPTQYFTRRITGKWAEVICPVPDDVDAIFWMPDAGTVLQYQRADMIILNGARFAKWVDRVSLPLSTQVDTAQSFKDSWIYFEGGITHSHGKSGAHSHTGVDGHTWVDPVYAIMQADAIKNAVIRLRPDKAALFEENFRSLKKDLELLDGRFREMTKQYDGHPILASHPAYNYIARRYGWRMISLDLDPEEMPNEDTLKAIQTILADKPARHIIWEAPPHEEIARTMQKRLQLQSVVFSPCELLSQEAQQQGMDYLRVMHANIENIRNIFSPRGE